MLTSGLTGSRSLIPLLFGPTATGKSTLGALLARRLGCSFLDADDVHPASNIAKMSRGEPLTDDDRWPWLDRIRSRMVDVQSRNESLVVACSALKRIYRQRLDPDGTLVQWVYLKGPRALIEQRLLARRGHFMKASMLDSQFEALEEPRAGEALIIDIAREPAAIVDDIVSWQQAFVPQTLVNSGAIEPGNLVRFADALLSEELTNLSQRHRLTQPGIKSIEIRALEDPLLLLT